MLTPESSLCSRLFCGNISVSSSITQLRELRDALCQPYPACDVGAFPPPASNWELNMKEEQLGKN